MNDVGQLLRDMRALEEALALEPTDTLARLALADALEEAGFDEESAWERLLVRHAQKWPCQHLFPLPVYCWRRLEGRQDPRWGKELAVMALETAPENRTAQWAPCTFFREGDERGPLGVLLNDGPSLSIWRPSSAPDLWARHSHGYTHHYRDYCRRAIGLMPSCEGIA